MRDSDDQGCPILGYGPTGYGSAVRFGEHNWRLVDEHPIGETHVVADGIAYTDITGWKRRWYCTRCRTIDTTESG